MEIRSYMSAGGRFRMIIDFELQGSIVISEIKQGHANEYHTAYYEPNDDGYTMYTSKMTIHKRIGHAIAEAHMHILNNKRYVLQLSND